MREILFRGERTYNGEWVEGFAIFADNKAFILNNAKVEFAKGFNENKLNFVLIEVIPETVGQYTGLTDKNGKKIFEGDIVEFSSKDYYGSSEKGKVIFSNGCFVIEYVIYDDITSFHRIGEVRKEIDMGATHIITYQYEVIGNIHDNPELLKEGAE